MRVTVSFKEVAVGTEFNIVQEGVPDVIPPEACYVGWQESLTFLAKLVDSLGLEMVKVTIGIRIYPDTDIARHTKRVGKFSADDNLLSQRFFIEDGMEAWLRNIVKEWRKDRPNWIH